MPASTTLPTTLQDSEGFQPRPMLQLDRALATFREAGVPIPNRENSTVALTGLAKDLVAFGDNEVAAIVRTLHQMQSFNEIVRTELNQTTAGDRYVQIASHFNSIREDSKRMLAQIEDGKLSVSERLQNSWMTWTRGSVEKRFQIIRSTSIDVHRASENTIARMRAVLTGYGYARQGLGEARILADTIRQRAKQAWEAAQAQLTAVSDTLAGLRQSNAAASEVNRVELDRDKAVTDVQEGERRYQIAEDLYNNLSIAYNAGDAIMVRIRQASDVQERVWSQSVTFFGTNESVLTALSAAFTQLRSLHETTQSHKAMKDGINEAIKDLATAGTTVMEAGLREGYGPTISADSIKALIDSIVSFQERSVAIKDEMRTLAQDNEREIHTVTENGRARLARLLSDSARPAALLPAP